MGARPEGQFAGLKPLQHADQAAKRIDHRICAQFVRRLVAIAIACRDHRNARRARCHHVIARIADNGEAAPTTAAERPEYRIGCGLGATSALRLFTTPAAPAPRPPRFEPTYPPPKLP